MSQPHQLYRLQQIDLELQDRKKRLVAVLTAQKEPADLLALREEAARCSQTVQKLRIQQKDWELQMGTVTRKMNQAGERLYSGKVRNPKELDDLQQSVAALKRQEEGLEESLLGVMVSLEEASTAVSAALALREQTWVEEVHQLKQEQMSAAMTINELTERRAQHIQQVQADKLADYEQIRRKKGGEAVSRLSQNMCERCRTGIPEAMTRAVNLGEYRHCPSCDRILVPMGQ